MSGHIAAATAAALLLMAGDHIDQPGMGAVLGLLVVGSYLVAVELHRPRPRAPDLDAVLRVTARGLLGHDDEWAVAFASDGMKVFAKRGARNEVWLSPRDGHVITGNHLLHQHPTGGPLAFSPADIHTAATLDVASTAVAGTDPRYGPVLLRLHRPPGGWSPRLGDDYQSLFQHVGPDAALNRMAAAHHAHLTREAL